MTLNISSMNDTAPGRSMLLVVAAALLDGKGRVLMQQRPPGKAHAGLWEFPGGKIEAGETPEQALVRELAEELAIVVEEDDLVPVGFATQQQDVRCIVMLLFACRRWSGVPQALDATDLRWGLPSDLAGLPMPPLDVPLVAGLIARAG